LKKSPFEQFGGKNPTDIAKMGIKHAVLVDRKWAPMFSAVFPANKHDSKTLKKTVGKMRKSKKIQEMEFR